MENDPEEISLIDMIKCNHGAPEEYDPENPGMKELVGAAISI